MHRASETPIPGPITSAVLAREQRRVGMRRREREPAARRRREAADVISSSKPRRDHRLHARRHADGHQTGAGARRRAARQHDRPGLAAAAGDDGDVAVRPLVRLGIARAEERRRVRRERSPRPPVRPRRSPRPGCRCRRPPAPPCSARRGTGWSRSSARRTRRSARPRSPCRAARRDRRRGRTGCRARPSARRSRSPGRSPRPPCPSTGRTEPRAEERVDDAAGTSERARERTEVACRDRRRLAACALPGKELGARRRGGSRRAARPGRPRSARASS